MGSGMEEMERTSEKYALMCAYYHASITLGRVMVDLQNLVFDADEGAEDLLSGSIPTERVMNILEKAMDRRERADAAFLAYQYRTGLMKEVEEPDELSSQEEWEQWEYQQRLRDVKWDIKKLEEVRDDAIESLIRSAGGIPPGGDQDQEAGD